MSDAESEPASVDEARRKRFEQGWMEGRPQPIDEFLPPQTDPRYAATLEELVHIELEFAWKAWAKARVGTATGGEATTVCVPPGVETYLARFPPLGQPEAALRLVEQEISLRRQFGDSVLPEEYRRRFPQLLQESAGALEALLEPLATQAPNAETRAFTGAVSAGAELPLGRFGNYELLGELGRGGMGVVYRARQLGADRTVALKVVRRDRLAQLARDTQTSALDRFRHEVHAAGRLEHDHIVTIYEVGEVEGQPFYSMRYVEGRSLSEILRDGPLANRRAAGYMEPVARAVEEAHRQGILHRDLKPANILVDARSDRAMVTDFGLAKLSEGGEELTRHGEIMGTPPYMSPEQAVDSSRVAAQSDVYALGATLYHLLTGRPPFQAATPVETMRQVIDREPAPPRQLNPSIDRDLETICLKCLRKEPARRYATAQDLADDLRRYLDRKPIRARPAGAVERAWRWCRRNPVVAGLIGLAAAFLAAALAATGIGYASTSAALAEARQSQRKSEESFRQAREAVDNFFTRVGDETLLNQPGMQPLRKDLLQEALRYYQRFLKQRGEDPSVRDELAATYFRVGRITEEIESPEQGLAPYRRARDMQRQLLAERPDDPARTEALGNTLNATGRALGLLRRWEEARLAYEEALKLRAGLAKRQPQSAEFQRALANAYMNLGLLDKERGRPDAARRQQEQAQAIRRQLLEGRRHAAEVEQLVRRDLALGHYNLANLALERGDGPAARENFDQAITLLEGVLRRAPGDLANQHRLGVCYRLLADLLCDSDPQAALVGYQRAQERLEPLARANPNVPQYQSALACVYLNLGGMHLQEQQAGPARDALDKARSMLEPLVVATQGDPQCRRDLAVTLWALATLDIFAGKQADARSKLESAWGYLRELAAAFPGNRDYAERLADVDAALAELEKPQSRP